MNIEIHCTISYLKKKPALSPTGNETLLSSKQWAAQLIGQLSMKRHLGSEIVRMLPKLMMKAEPLALTDHCVVLDNLVCLCAVTSDNTHEPRGCETPRGVMCTITFHPTEKMWGFVCSPVVQRCTKKWTLDMFEKLKYRSQRNWTCSN